jgi:hypothetical protein
MSGPTNTEWSKYLNGGSSQYNFSYRKRNTPEIAPPLEPMPVVPNPKLDSKLNVSKLAKNMKGGKRKTRRKNKKYTISRRK